MSNDIEALTEEWLRYLHNSEEERAVEFYCQQITPALIPSLRKGFVAIHGQDGHYDGLVSLLGFTPETVVLACQFVQPQTLVLLHTKETSHLLDAVVRYSGVSQASFFHEPFEEQPSRDIYVALERALQRFPPGSRIAIELTGGKKTMGGALAVAAGILDTDLLYIDYSEYMPSFRKPKPSSTYIHLVENPMRVSVDLFGGIEIKRALAFFNIGKLEVAEELLTEAATRMGNPRVAELAAGLARFYALWNRFDFSGAAESGNELFAQALRFHQEVVSKVTFDLHRLRLQLEVVAKLNASDRTAILLNFFFTAERYEQNGQHDIAALLYYRTIEDVHSNRLLDIAPLFKREEPDYSLLGIPLEQLVCRFNETRSRFFKAREGILEELPNRLALLDTVILLDALDDNCFANINRSRLIGLAEIRNHSMFAHGLRPLTASSIEGLRRLAQECLDVYLSATGYHSIDASREAFTFMDLTLHGRGEAASPNSSAAPDASRASRSRRR